VTLPTLGYALPAYYLIAMSEASSNLARYDGLRYGYAGPEPDADWSATFSRNRRDGFGAEVKRRIILGTYALSAGYYDRYYLKALQIRTLLRRDFDRIFTDFDVVAGPTMPVPPFLLGEKIADPLSLYMCDALTIPVNLTGHPAISLPCGFSEGLPVGLQLMAPALREDVLLRVAYAFERHIGIAHQTPPM
jgi:aspartyl-tRNA(Asn)/glutamyl-tRNA(Gln) amidotransferase subunit A